MNKLIKTSDDRVIFTIIDNKINESIQLYIPYEIIIQWDRFVSNNLINGKIVEITGNLDNASFIMYIATYFVNFIDYFYKKEKKDIGILDLFVKNIIKLKGRELTTHELDLMCEVLKYLQYKPIEPIL
jgi:hypothetical protein